MTDPGCQTESHASISDHFSATVRQKIEKKVKQLEEEVRNLRNVLAGHSETDELLKEQKAVIHGMNTESNREFEKALEEAKASVKEKGLRNLELELQHYEDMELIAHLRKDLAEYQALVNDFGGLDYQLQDSYLELPELQNRNSELEAKLSESERRNEDLRSQVEISGGQLQELQRELCALKETLCNSKLEAERVAARKDEEILRVKQKLQQLQPNLDGTACLSQHNSTQPQLYTRYAPIPSSECTTFTPRINQSLTIVVPPRPSVPFDDSFRMGVTRDRREAFRQDPLFIDMCHALPDDSTFSRGFLMDKLGGASQGVVARVVNKKPLSVLHDIGQGMIYPQPTLNPWLPAMPGAHGYMFVGLRGPGKDHERFLEPAKWSLFLPKGKCWEYYGEYEVHRQPDLDLSIEEWDAFSTEFKKGYSECTAKKEKPHADITAAVTQVVRDQYDTGELRVPCTALKCVGYNRQLVLDLINPPPSLKRIATETPRATPRAKRKRTTKSP